VRVTSDDVTTGEVGARLRRASLSLHTGEVLGIAGLIGAGRTQLLRAIFGLDAVRSGKLRVGIYAGPASPARRWAQRVGMVSEDRKVEGLALDLSIADNLTLSSLPTLLTPARQAAGSQIWLKRLAVRCRSPHQSVGDLSGGNQQKIAVARLLHHDVDVLLLDEPTRGIDVASKAQIYQTIDELAGAGKAILMVSSYLPELLGVCDRPQPPSKHRERCGQAGGRHGAWPARCWDWCSSVFCSRCFRASYRMRGHSRQWTTSR
jgi:ribose transport system ATP-binding protein